jgi:hypothetical protein
MFKCEKFYFDWEQRMTSIEAIKLEAFRSILSYHGILERRRSSIIHPELGAPDNQLQRRPSTFADQVQKDLIIQMEKLVQESAANNRTPPTPTSDQSSSVFGKLKKFFGGKK